MTERVIIDEIDIDELQFEKEVEKEVDPTARHYVDNKALYASFVVYKDKFKLAMEAGEGKPQLSDEICRAIIAIANKHSYSRRFINYSNNWKEEMVSDAIDICVRYVHNFNTDKYENPFAYITQLVTHAFHQRLEKEYKQMYFRYKLYERAGGFSGQIDENMNDYDIDAINDDANSLQDEHSEFIKNFEQGRADRKEKYRRKREPTTPKINRLTALFGDEDE